MKKHTKRFMLIFSTWVDEIKNFDEVMKRYYSNKFNIYTHHKEYIDEFDTLEEAKQAISMYQDMYKDTPKPQKVMAHYYNIKTKEIVTRPMWGHPDRDFIKHIEGYFDFSDGAMWWGYIVLDFEAERVVYAGGDNPENINYKNSLAIRDKYFRKDGEIPNGYVWDDGEYDGWLRFRWGDGQNAVGYVPKSKKKEDVIEEASEEDLEEHVINYTEADRLQDEFDEQYDKELVKYNMDKYGW